MEEEIEVKLFSSSNEYEINQICTILEDNNIHFIRKSAGTGSYMNLYMGQSIQEKTVFVNKSDYDKSIELISAFTSNNTVIEETSETDKKSIKNAILMRHGLGLLVLGIPILLIISIIIVSLINN